MKTKDTFQSPARTDFIGRVSSRRANYQKYERHRSFQLLTPFGWMFALAVIGSVFLGAAIALAT